MHGIVVATASNSNSNSINIKQTATSILRNCNAQGDR